MLAVLLAEAEDRHTSIDAVVRAALEEHAERWQRRKLVGRALARMDALSDEILTSRGGVPTTDGASMLRQDRGW